MQNKEFLKTFKTVLCDAATTFGRPAHSVSLEQWRYASRGRVSTSLVRIFGFASLRSAVAPAPDTSKKEAIEARKMIERLVTGA